MAPCEARWPFEACSYGGYCNETSGECICTYKFVDRGDFWPTQGINCVVPRYLRDGLLVITIAIALFSLMFRIWELHRAKKAKDNYRGSGKNPNDRIFRYHAVGFFMSLTCVAMSLWSWIWREDSLGKHFLKTLLFTFSVHVTCFEIHYVANFCIESVEILLGALSPEKKDWHFVFVTRYSVFFTYMGVIYSSIVCPFGMYFSKSSSQDERWALYFAVSCVYMVLTEGCILLFSIEGFISTVQKVIEHSNQTTSDDRSTMSLINRLQTLMKRARTVKLIIGQTLVSIFSISVAICFWPWARSFIILSVININFSVTASDAISQLLARVVVRNTINKMPKNNPYLSINRLRSNQSPATVLPRSALGSKSSGVLPES